MKQNFIEPLVGINFNTTVRDRLDVTALSDLSNSLVLLAEHAFWTDDNIISVIDEIIGMIQVTYIHDDNLKKSRMSCNIYAD